MAIQAQAGIHRLTSHISSQFSTKGLVLVPIAVGINVIGGTVTSALKLPLFLDMIGTIVVACLSGPWVAALCGLLTNIFLAIVSNPVNLPYAAVSVLVALAVGYLIKAGCFQHWWGVVIVWVVCTLVNAASAALVTTFVFGGATGLNGTSVLTAGLVTAMKNVLASVFSSAIMENLLDKGITIVVAYMLVRKIPRRFLWQYAAGSLGQEPEYGEPVSSVTQAAAQQSLTTHEEVK